MIKVEDLSKKYTDHVLDGISFHLKKGEVLAIGGKNGSGKSTVLKIITSIIEPDSGNVFVKGKNIKDNPEIIKDIIGYVSQENSLFDDLTVAENIDFFSSLYKIQYSDFSFEKSFLKKKVSELSGGMRKRVNILISTLSNPDCLILDEPTANLDLYYKNQIMDIIKEQKNNDKSVIITTHDTEELLLSDRLIILKNGKIIFNDIPKLLNTKDNFKDEYLKLI